MKRGGALGPGHGLGVLLGVLVCLLVGSCERRERANPFDPENPDTGGVPALLNARAGDGRVSLAWDLGPLEGIVLTRVHRRYREDVVKDLTPNGLDPSIRTFEDLSPENGVRYEYRLQLELLGGETALSAWDAATPGDAIAWVADSDGGGLSRLTPDARDRILRVGQGWFLDLAVDSLDRSLWSVDYLEGALLHYSLDGSELARAHLPGARAVAVDLDSSSVWVGSFDLRRLERRRRDGALAWADSSAGFVEDLLAVEPSGVWLANRDGEIRLYRDDQRLVLITELRHPVALATSTEGWILVLERGTEEGAARVRRYDPFGIPQGIGSETLSSPTDVTQDGAGGAWVADPGRGGLVHLGAGLEELQFIPLAGALGVTWDARDRRLWVAGTSGVSILDADGVPISGLSIGPRPIKVEVIHGSGVD